MRKYWLFAAFLLLAIAGCAGFGQGVKDGSGFGDGAAPTNPGSGYGIGNVIGEALKYILTAAVSWGGAYLVHGGKSSAPSA